MAIDLLVRFVGCLAMALVVDSAFLELGPVCPF
jgi:hypothetical protein